MRERDGALAAQRASDGRAADAEQQAAASLADAAEANRALKEHQLENRRLVAALQEALSRAEALKEENATLKGMCTELMAREERKRLLASSPVKAAV